MSAFLLLPVMAARTCNLTSLQGAIALRYIAFSLTPFWLNIDIPVLNTCNTRLCFIYFCYVMMDFMFTVAGSL